MRTACYLGRGFSVVTTLGRTIGRARDLAEIYGASRFLRNVRACEIGVLELEDPASDARRVITEECRRAVVEDAADAVVLGCAGTADLASQISDTVGVPVIDGVAAATRTVETLVALGLRTGSRGEFATPPAKPYTGILRNFQIP
jgi:allantoin racemase